MHIYEIPVENKTNPIHCIITHLMCHHFYTIKLKPFEACIQEYQHKPRLFDIMGEIGIK